MTRPAREPVLVAQSMGKSFGSTEVLKGATLWCHGGQVTILIGRNGAGKSTLLDVTLGVLSADYGVVRMCGWVSERPRPAELARRGVFYGSQTGTLIPALSLRRHLYMMAGRFGGDPDAVAERLGLTAVLDLRAYQVSGGEAKRAEFALALLREPLVVIADEPFAGITPADRGILSTVFRGLAAAGCSVVLTGHDAPDLFAVADQVTWVTAGTTHQLGTPEQALEHDQFVREYLGPGGRDAVRGRMEWEGLR